MEENEASKWPRQKIRWTTTNEITFLRRLGFWKRGGLHRPRGSGRDEERRRNLLIKYWETMKGRVDWGDIDRSKVEAYLKRCLEKEERQK